MHIHKRFSCYPILFYNDPMKGTVIFTLQARKPRQKYA